jgi:uncharacterized protein YigA (DUF484 family)
MTTSITLQLPDDIAQQLKTEAQKQNTTPENIAAQFLMQALRPNQSSQTSFSETNPGVKPEDELAQLRGTISQVTNQLQELLQRGEAAAVVPRVLNRLTLMMREATTVPELLTTVVNEARTALRTDRVIVYTFDENWKGTVVAESVGKGFQAALGAKIADPCFADRYVKPYLKGRISATPNIQEAGLTDCHLKQLEPFGVKANLVVPILANQKLYGLLIAHQCDAPRQWVDIETEFFAQLALQLGYAIDPITIEPLDPDDPLLQMFNSIYEANQTGQDRIQAIVTPLTHQIADSLVKQQLIERIEVDDTQTDVMTLYLPANPPLTPQFSPVNYLQEFPTDDPEELQILQKLQDPDPSVRIQGITALRERCLELT